MSRLDRCLRRYGISNLKSLVPEEKGEATLLKAFKSYDPGFIHADIEHLPQMPDETIRKYLFAAIDRATRWTYMETISKKSAKSAEGFLKNLIKVAPFVISKILTDNGREFTDRFAQLAKGNQLVIICLTRFAQPTA
uniref:IS481 family transposase n=1 Tax=Desulfogranum mediterraneum TaxID=160661 RepID=UPI00048FD235|nr:IS481 family transposase [Desulfogranum mediterraneum]